MYLLKTNRLAVSFSLWLLLFSSANSIASAANSSSAVRDFKQKTLTLEYAIKMAQKNDPWLIGNQHQQDAIDSMSISVETLPDPRISLGIANIAADSFDFNQEGMTQFKIGMSQMFPRGDTLTIKRQQLEQIGAQFPFQRLDRKAKVKVIVSNLWLETYKAQESIALIEKNRALFEQLADVAQASYSSAMGKTRQQDIVRAQLELTRLDDRLTVLKQQKEVSLQKLSQWLNNYSQETDIVNSKNIFQLQVEKKLPNTSMRLAALFNSQEELAPQDLIQYFSKHPAVKSIEQKIKASKTEIEIAN